MAILQLLSAASCRLPDGRESGASPLSRHRPAWIEVKPYVVKPYVDCTEIEFRSSCPQGFSAQVPHFATIISEVCKRANACGSGGLPGPADGVAGGGVPERKAGGWGVPNGTAAGNSSGAAWPHAPSQAEGRCQVITFEHRGVYAVFVNYVSSGVSPCRTAYFVKPATVRIFNFSIS